MDVAPMMGLVITAAANNHASPNRRGALDHSMDKCKYCGQVILS